MYSLYHDNRNKCASLIPHFDDCCNYYMDRGLHVEGKLFDEVGLVSAIIGDLKMSVRSADYEGWLICDGRAVSRSTYKDLYDLIGDNFGAGDGETTFNLPNAQGRVLGSVVSNLTTKPVNVSVRCVGDVFGEETHTLLEPQMPPHIHSATDGGHTHSYVNQIGDQNTDNAFGTETAADQADYNQTTSMGYANITIGSTGGGQPHNNMQPTLFIGNTFIYSGVKSGSSEFVFPACGNTYYPPPCLD